MTVLGKVGGFLRLQIWRLAQNKRHGFRFVLSERILQLTSSQAVSSPRQSPTSGSQERPHTKPMPGESAFAGSGSHAPCTNQGKPESSPVQKTHRLEAESACILHGASLICGGTAVLHDHSYLSGIWRERDYPESDFIAAAETWMSNDRPTQTLGGLSLCMTGPWTSNYYHWLVQQLPRLAIAAKTYQLEKIDHILVAGPVRDFQIQSLAAYGIDRQKIVPVSWNEVLKTESLLLTTIPSANYHTPAWVVDFLRQAKSRKSSQESAVFLNRRHPSQRVIVNADEVESMLADLGIRCVDCGRLSFQEQVDLASSADILLGIHGASLANCVFCKPGSLLLELTPRNYALPYFEHLSKTCALRFQRILGSEPGPLPGQQPIADADMIIPVNKLKAQMLNELNSLPHID